MMAILRERFEEVIKGGMGNLIFFSRIFQQFCYLTAINKYTDAVSIIRVIPIEICQDSDNHKSNCQANQNEKYSMGYIKKLFRMCTMG